MNGYRWWILASRCTSCSPFSSPFCFSFIWWVSDEPLWSRRAPFHQTSEPTTDIDISTAVGRSKPPGCTEIHRTPGTSQPWMTFRDIRDLAISANPDSVSIRCLPLLSSHFIITIIIYLETPATDGHRCVQNCRNKCCLLYKICDKKKIWKNGKQELIHTTA